MSIASELQRIQSAKSAIKTAIENKGGSVGDSIDSYAAAIDALSLGGGSGSGSTEEPMPELDYNVETPMYFLTTEDNTTIGFLEKSSNDYMYPSRVSLSNIFSYSTDKENWTELPGTGVTFPKNTRVYIKGSTNTLSSATYFYRQFSINKPVYCAGNIRSLLNALNTDPITYPNYCFYKLFLGTPIITAPSITNYTGDTPGNYSWAYMFSACPLLKKTPDIYSTKLNQRSCQYMFSDCGSLTEFSIFNPVTLSDYCCSYMFYACSNLKRTPNILPATTLATYCYEHMFQGCVSLEKTPILPATSGKANYCYSYMFYECISLKYITSYMDFTSSSSPGYYTTHMITNVPYTGGIYVKHISSSWNSKTDAGSLNWDVIYYNPSTGKYYLPDKTTECDEYGNPI